MPDNKVAINLEEQPVPLEATRREVTVIGGGEQITRSPTRSWYPEKPPTTEYTGRAAHSELTSNFVFPPANTETVRHSRLGGSFTLPQDHTITSPTMSATEMTSTFLPLSQQATVATHK